MHLKKGTTTNGKAILMLLGIVFGVTAFLSNVHAQTILSPTPIMPLQEGPLLDIPSVTTLEAADTSDEKSFHIPLILNHSVESQIEYFTTRGRSVFQSWLNRSARYLSTMKKIFREYNLPEDLVYVAMIESGFNPQAVSPKKAVGCWQFMMATAREYGLNADRWVDERRDPIKSTRAAAAHFKDLYNLFGSWLMALASYNAGMGTMQGAALRAGSDDFWELSAARFIRMETQEYVPRYMAALIIAKNPVAYGFTAPGDKPLEYDEVIVHNSMDLRRIADYTGSSCKDIQELNPELLQLRTPKNRYVLRIPRGTKNAYHQRVAKAPVQEPKKAEETHQTRIGGVLFTRLASQTPQNLSSRAATWSTISPYASPLGFADSTNTAASSSTVPPGQKDDRGPIMN